jgi:5-dehydro-4-deoxyglucarate dehydratase
MTSGLVNLDPALSLAIWDAARRGDESAHRSLIAERAQGIFALRRSRPGYHITVLKEAMHMLGRSGPTVRLPLVPLRDDERLWVRDYLVSAHNPVSVYRNGAGEPS